MVIRQQNSETGATQIIVTGNKAMSWRANVVLAASLSALSAVFGGVIALLGFWLVLPFAGLEFAVVLYCLGKTYRKLGYTEVISFQESTVTVECGFDRPEDVIELPKPWTKLEFDNPSSLFEVGTLLIKAGGKRHELGRLLNKEEKRTLHNELQSCLRLEAPSLRLIS